MFLGGAVYWDLVMDWGLLRRKARNPWLRDQLLLKHNWIYFAAMVSAPTRRGPEVLFWD